MARPIILGVVGDSATGKTTLTKGLVEILGQEHVTHIGMDDYHCYDRAGAQRARDHAAESRLQLHGHHRPAPRAPAQGRADPQARLPARRRHVRPARLRQAAALRAHRGAARLPHDRTWPRTSTCASTSRRPRSCAATGRSSATRRSAATPRSRCSPSSTCASPTPRRSSARSARARTSSSPSRPERTTIPITSTRCSRCATACRTPTSRRWTEDEGRAAIEIEQGDLGAQDPHPGGHRPRSRRRHRGGHLGADALRTAPADRAARDVRGRHRRGASLRVAGDHPGPDPLPPRDGEGDGRHRRRRRRQRTRLQLVDVASPA